MRKGIHEKDIRDFEKYVEKLNGVMKRIWTYKPEARVYATPGELNLMAGFLEDCGGYSPREEQDKMLVATADFDKLETGDW